MSARSKQQKKQTAPDDMMVVTIQNDSVDQQHGSSKKANSPPKRGKLETQAKPNSKDKRKSPTAPHSVAALRKELVVRKAIFFQTAPL